MPVTEGTTEYPKDSAAQKGNGPYDGTNFWLWRGDNRGHAGVLLYDTNGNPLVHRQPGSDADAATGAYHHPVIAVPELFNESTFDRQRNNTQLTLLASASRSATTFSAQQTNYNARGVIVVVNVTVLGAGSTLTVYLLGVDPISGSTFQLNGGSGSVGASSTITATGIYAVALYPGAVAAAAAVATALVIQSTPVPLPRGWEAEIFHSNANACTYSVSGLPIL